LEEEKKLLSETETQNNRGVERNKEEKKEG
jgi:hypothetical protein